MKQVRKALRDLEKSQRVLDQAKTITFEEYLALLRKNPSQMIRTVHQVFHDMVQSFVGAGYDEYPEDPESINFISYDCRELFVADTDQPFFADRIFANRLMAMIDGFRGGAQQNKIYIFDGPPGCGKSIFLNNLLRKFEEYANSPAGVRYEAVWRLDSHRLEEFGFNDGSPILEKLASLLEGTEGAQDLGDLPASRRPRIHKEMERV